MANHGTLGLVILFFLAVMLFEFIGGILKIPVLIINYFIYLIDKRKRRKAGVIIRQFNSGKFTRYINLDEERERFARRQAKKDQRRKRH